MGLARKAGASPLIVPAFIAQAQYAGTRPTVAGQAVLTLSDRALNTIVRNEIGASLGSNVVTVPAGAYYFRAKVPCAGTSNTTPRILIDLYDITNAKVLAMSNIHQPVEKAPYIFDCYAEFTTATQVKIREGMQNSSYSIAYGQFSIFGTVTGVPDVFTELGIFQC